MKKREKGRIGRGLFVLIIAAASILAGYYLGLQKGNQEKKGSVRKPISASVEKKPSQATPPKVVVIEEMPSKEEADKTKPPKEDYSCDRLRNEIREFFKYLDTKNYIRHLELGMGTYDCFKQVIMKLSSNPPIPGGEGIDPRIMISNIYHLFRALDKKELRLIREVTKNEADTVEFTLRLFYKWLMEGERCPGPEGMRPSPEILYQYAGFLLNTIGGRAYLFRRPTELRVLLSYYCLLIIHEADKKGKNTYGVDIFPEISPILNEIRLIPNIQFQDDYIQDLTRLQNYYIKKRE
ncbi:MAG: hypothetical protein V1930_04180 [Pseudomonadota bacterium]